MTQPIVTKAEIPGRCLEPGKQDEYLIRQCKDIVSIAGTLRRSSLPDEALQLLRGVYPVLIQVIHRRFVGRGLSITTGAKLEDLIAGGHIS